jgi:hypothetical protein
MLERAQLPTPFVPFIFPKPLHTMFPFLRLNHHHAHDSKSTVHQRIDFLQPVPMNNLEKNSIEHWEWASCSDVPLPGRLPSHLCTDRAYL